MNAIKAGDEFVMCLFPGVDTLSHLSHTTSARVLDTYREIDKTVGDVCRILQESDDFDDTLILITSDHGMSNTHTHIDVPRHLEIMGLRCLHYPLLWRQQADSSSMVSGNGMAHVYVKGQNIGTTGAAVKPKSGWGECLSIEQLNGIGVIDPAP
ncbi:MAG: alkaline phosphatase family protein [Candidatus Poribacteria bacterium]|nr:alkaline phosphatase family protein [Candidatus Poribacteria bacterium]